MAEQAGAFLVPTMQMTREDKAMLKAGKLPMQAAWNFAAMWTRLNARRSASRGAGTGGLWHRLRHVPV